MQKDSVEAFATSVPATLMRCQADLGPNQEVSVQMILAWLSSPTYVVQRTSLPLLLFSAPAFLSSFRSLILGNEISPGQQHCLFDTTTCESRSRRIDSRYTFQFSCTGN